MRTNWIFKLCVPLASASILVGCTQEVGDDQTQNREPRGRSLLEPEAIERAKEPAHHRGRGT